MAKERTIAEYCPGGHLVSEEEGRLLALEVREVARGFDDCLLVWEGGGREVEGFDEEGEKGS